MAINSLREGQRYPADPTLWHERVVLGRSSTGELFFLTPDHEITQEVADFLVLISQGRMTFAQAALGNFVSALGIIVGCIVASNPKSSSSSNLQISFKAYLRNYQFYRYIFYIF